MCPPEPLAYEASAGSCALGLVRWSRAVEQEEIAWTAFVMREAMKQWEAVLQKG